MTIPPGAYRAGRGAVAADMEKAAGGPAASIPIGAAPGPTAHGLGGLFSSNIASSSGTLNVTESQRNSFVSFPAS
jgi:hypothetical protein